MNIPIDLKQAAALLKCDERTVRRYQNNEVDPLPIKERGKRGCPHTYCAVQVVDWRLRRELGKLTISDDGQVHDYDAERARLTHHQANKTELEAKVLSGQLIPAEIVEAVQGAMVGAFRSKLLSLPTKSAGKIQNLSDIAEIEDSLRAEVHEALTELSEYEPSAYGVSIIQKNSGDSGATADDDGEQLG